MRTQSENRQTAWNAGKRGWSIRFDFFSLASDWLKGLRFVDQSQGKVNYNQSNSGSLSTLNWKFHQCTYKKF